MNNPSFAAWIRDSKLVLLAELGIFAAVFVADFLGYIPFSKTPFLVAFVILSWRLARIDWRDVGLRPYINWPLTVALGVAAGGVTEGFQLFASQPFVVTFTGAQPDLSDFAELRGNTEFLLILLALVWTIAAFGEEIVYRGYLLNRLEDLFAPAHQATLLSLVIMSAVIGMAHGYQGITGIVDEGLMGLSLGLFYLGFGRNLVIPIVAHGVQDTIDMLLIYSGNYPGLN
jgi:hypothetical protein